MLTKFVQQFEALWESSDSPSDVFSFLQQHNGSSVDDAMAVLLADQKHRWKTDSPLKVEDYLQGLPELGSNADALPDIKLQLAVGEFQARQAAGNDT